jgi:hypothetical protein
VDVVSSRLAAEQDVSNALRNEIRALRSQLDALKTLVDELRSRDRISALRHEDKN